MYYRCSKVEEQTSMVLLEVLLSTFLTCWLEEGGTCRIDISIFTSLPCEATIKNYNKDISLHW